MIATVEFVLCSSCHKMHEQIVFQLSEPEIIEGREIYYYTICPDTGNMVYIISKEEFVNA